MKYFILLILLNLVRISSAEEDHNMAYNAINYVKESDEYNLPVNTWPTGTEKLVPRYSILSRSEINTLVEFKIFMSERPEELIARQPIIQVIELDDWFLCEISNLQPTNEFKKDLWMVAYLVEKNTRKIYYYWSW